MTTLLTSSTARSPISMSRPSITSEADGGFPFSVEGLHPFILRETKGMVIDLEPAGSSRLAGGGKSHGQEERRFLHHHTLGSKASLIVRSRGTNAAGRLDAYMPMSDSSDQVILLFGPA